MGSTPNKTPLVVVIGCTASGKSKLAHDIARAHGGEIIAADSRTIYRGMNIGTAKPSAQEMSEIRHHLIDVVNPDEEYSAVNFKTKALRAIADIASRDKLPIMVGGTGLYTDSVLFNFTFREPGLVAERQKLAELSVAELQQKLHERDIPLPENEQNPRHLIRAIETKGSKPKAESLRPNTIIIGLDIDREILQERIARRVEDMFSRGLEGEVKGLAERFGWGAPALRTIGYQEFRPYFSGEATLDEVKQEIIRDTKAYAKRQRTWFKRNKSIHWISEQAEAEDLITTFLSK